MQKIGIVLMMVLGVLVALLLGGAAMVGFSGFGMDSGMMSGIVAMIAPMYLIITIGLGLLLVFWLSRPRTRPVAAKVSPTSALDISKTRYAKGEITKEQYDAIKHDLDK
jgi:uncharacterized membrane protein